MIIWEDFPFNNFFPSPSILMFGFWRAVGGGGGGGDGEDGEDGEGIEYYIPSCSPKAVAQFFCQSQLSGCIYLN